MRDHFEACRARAATLRDGEGLPRVVERAFWTPEYLAAKTRKIAAAGLGSLILVVYRGLAVGNATSALESLVGDDRIVWFTARPRAADVVRAAERCAVP